jgi:hypothetical protein
VAAAEPALRLRIARYAQLVDEFEAALAHYVAYLAQGGALAGLVKERIADVEAILRDREALAAIRRARGAVLRRRFRHARALLAAAKRPDLGGEARARLARAHAFLAAQRETWLRSAIGRRFPAVARALIEATVHAREMTLSEATGWARRALRDEIRAALARSWHEVDDVPPEEVRALWRKRRRASWRTASYGAGTFVVERPRPVPGASSPAPPRPGDWWDGADGAARAAWLTAWFVERPGLFDVRRGHVACERCEGRGLEPDRAAGAWRACRRCHALARDRVVRYR